MSTVRVQHTIGDLARDMSRIPVRFVREGNKVVRDNAYKGNTLAKGFASEQHTMFGDEDVEYPPSFTVEKLGPSNWVYGPDIAIGDGSQAEGYELGSINSPPHFDLARSVDVIGIEFPLDVDDMMHGLFW